MRVATRLSTRTESRNGVTRIAVTGELDISTVPILEHRLSLINGEDVTAIMLDLRKLNFLDSSGLHAFEAASEQARSKGRILVVVGVGLKLRRSFELTGTLSLIEGSDAVAVLRQFTGVSTRQGSSPTNLGVHANA